MKVNANIELNYRKVEQRMGVINRTSLKYWKKQAHKEDRRNAKVDLNLELAAI